MTRFTSSSMQALSEQSLIAYRMLADVGVTSGTIYCCTGRQYLYTLGNTYSPVGHLGDVSPIGEESDAFPRDIVMRLSGVNTIAATGSLSIYEPLRESMFNRPVSLYRSYLDTQTMTMVHTPELIWKGKIESVDVLLEDGVYEVRAVSALRKSALAAYFNRETLRAVDSSSTFADHVDRIPLFKSMWGGNPTFFNGGGYGSPRGSGMVGMLYQRWQTYRNDRGN